MNRPYHRTRRPGHFGPAEDPEVGTALLEFALCVSLWVLCVSGIVFGAWLLYADHFVAHAANQATRYAAVRGSSWSSSCASVTSAGCTATSDNVKSFVKNMLAPGLSPDALDVSVTWPGDTASGTACDNLDGSNSPNCVVNVEVSYKVSLPVPLTSVRTVQLRSDSQLSILQ